MQPQIKQGNIRNTTTNSGDALDLHLICTLQLLHIGTRTPGPAALFRMPRPRLGAEVAPKTPPLLPPAPAESSTLEFKFRSLRFGGKATGAAAAGGAAALTALAITDFGAIGALNGALG